MSTVQATLFQDETRPHRAISPYRELGAHEALWLRDGMTVKGLADLFREAHPGAVPSDFIDEDEAVEHANEAIQVLKDAGVDSFGVRVHGAGEYPERLRDARHPVELLCYQGWWELAGTPSVAVVGTRKPSEDGRRRARKMARKLAEAGFTVVSGLAEGIDTEAHTAAMEAPDGRTVAVIGTPLSDVYPRANRALQERIARDYLLVSQIPILRYRRQNFRVNRFFFPERNVTMSALTQATVIIEAGESSGTLTQARAAFYQGRKLFILDSCFNRTGLTWPARFERQGAIRVRDFEDVERNLDLP